jgi:cysteinyl-tRNA synthetase
MNQDFISIFLHISFLKIIKLKKIYVEFSRILGNVGLIRAITKHVHMKAC